VEFARPWLDRIHAPTAFLESPAEFQGGPLVWLAHRLLEEHRNPDNVSSLAVEGVALELLAACARSPAEITQTRPPLWLERVRELVSDRFSENLSLGEIAATVGVSADHLARWFRRFHGCTMGEYARRRRVEFACQRLANSEEPLIQIALGAGFTDQSHFTKIFKRTMGVTPAVFRHLHSRRMRRTKE
jgi:AraC family transcriptional regulator